MGPQHCGWPEAVSSSPWPAWNMTMLWHKQSCEVLVRAPYLRGVKRNCLIQFRGGKRMIVPCRALRREKAQGQFGLGLAPGPGLAAPPGGSTGDNQGQGRSPPVALVFRWRDPANQLHDWALARVARARVRGSWGAGARDPGPYPGDPGGPDLAPGPGLAAPPGGSRTRPGSSRTRPSSTTWSSSSTW